MKSSDSTPIITIIRPNRSWLKVDWAEIWAYRDLLILLVRRDFVSKYKQTILGPAWFVIQPLVMTLVFSILFNKVARLSTDELPPTLFYLGGLLLWNYCSQVFIAIAGVFQTNAHLFGKVYFPRLIVPFSQALTGFIAFALQLSLFFVLYVYFKTFFAGDGAVFGVNSSVLLLPLVLFMVCLLAMGVGLILASFTAKYRDLAHTIPFLTQIWLYATPVIYPVSQIPEKWQWILYFNPMTAWVESARFMLLGNSSINPSLLISASLISIFLFLFGLLLFNRTQRTFVDTV